MAFPALTNIKYRDLVAATSNNDDAIAWAKTHGLLPVRKICICGNVMSESERHDVKDGLQWRCPRPCRRRVGYRVGTFFENSHLSIQAVIDIIYNWAFEELSMKKAKRELGITSHTIVDWRHFMRNICAEHFVLNPVALGGPGVEVQIDESVFSRRKNNVGRVLPQQWVFGGFDVLTKKGFLVAVPQRNALTLLPIIQQYILPGTTVVSDMWAAYNTIGNIGYNHLTVNHSLNFVDPVTGAHTNSVENMWMRAKRRNKKECGTSRELLDSYLVEFMWRLSFDEDPFQNIIAHIRNVYPQ
jgi:transposase-like protein